VWVVLWHTSMRDRDVEYVSVCLRLLAQESIGVQIEATDCSYSLWISCRGAGQACPSPKRREKVGPRTGPT
jgi:hypothetical protein